MGETGDFIYWDAEHTYIAAISNELYMKNCLDFYSLFGDVHYL